MATITEFIQPTGWVVKDVPRDSNSTFSAVVRQLSQADYDCATEHCQYTAETLQQAVMDHLLENPFEDVADHKRMSTALTAISELFSATIHLLNADGLHFTIESDDPQIMAPRMFLAVVGGDHFVSVESSQTHRHVVSDFQNNTGDGESRSEDKQTDEDREQAEDELDLEHQVELRGLAYETCLQREDIDGDAEATLSVAPGEGKTPISITKDDFFEEMFNPTKYPYGKGGLKTPRDAKLTMRRYFNQRLLDVDGRFGKDMEYLLTAQYTVEDTQVRNSENIVMRQSQGRRHRGAALTAGSVKNKEVLRQMIQKDDAYKFLKQVRGSPAYFQVVQYEVLAMIRQLGLPTWFLTLSAADLQWPDVIQSIARQYGTTFTDEDIQNMSFEDKSKWLAQNPVTAAKHFQYRLNTFFHKFLKSKAHSLTCHSKAPCSIILRSL